MENAMQVAALVASTVSIALAILAIALAIVFYGMSASLSNRMRDLESKIASDVKQMGALFDRFYKETYADMRETHADMRKHLWPLSSDDAGVSALSEEKAEEKIQALRREIRSEVATTISQLGETDARVKELQGRMEKVVDNAITRSSTVRDEAADEAIRERLLNAIDFLAQKSLSITAANIVGLLEPTPAYEVLAEIRELHREGVLEIESSDRGSRRGDEQDEYTPIRPDTRIGLHRK